MDKNNKIVMVLCLHLSPTWFCLTSSGIQWIRRENTTTLMFLSLFYFIVCCACVFTAVLWVIHLMCHLIQPTLEPLKSLHVATQSPFPPPPPRCSTGSHMLTLLKFWNDLELVFGHLLEGYFSKTVYIFMLPLPSWSGLGKEEGGGWTLSQKQMLLKMNEEMNVTWDVVDRLKNLHIARLSNEEMVAHRAGCSTSRFRNTNKQQWLARDVSLDSL